MLRSLSAESQRREWKQRLSLRGSRHRDPVSLFSEPPVKLILLRKHYVYSCELKCSDMRHCAEANCQHQCGH